MPIRDHQSKESPPCACCSQITHTTTGIVDTGAEDGATYIARWDPLAPDRGIALLIGIGDSRGFVAATYNLKTDGISIMDPQDYDWHAPDLQIMERSQVINSPVASLAFRVIDEIWIHDAEVRQFIATHQEREVIAPNAR